MTTFVSGFSPTYARIRWTSWLWSHDPKTARTWTRPPSFTNGRYPFFDRAIWEESAGAEDAARVMEEEEEWFDKDQWPQAEAEGALGRLLVLALSL